MVLLFGSVMPVEKVLPQNLSFPRTVVPNPKTTIAGVFVVVASTPLGI